MLFVHAVLLWLPSRLWLVLARQTGERLGRWTHEVYLFAGIEFEWILNQAGQILKISTASDDKEEAKKIEERVKSLAAYITVSLG